MQDIAPMQPNWSGNQNYAQSPESVPEFAQRERPIVQSILAKSVAANLVLHESCWVTGVAAKIANVVRHFHRHPVRLNDESCAYSRVAVPIISSRYCFERFGRIHHHFQSVLFEPFSSRQIPDQWSLISAV